MRDVVTIETPSLGNRSYLVHDGNVALVVDPPRDIGRLLDVADGAGVTITHVVETHVHNDQVSGGLALARRTGATHGHAAAESLTFDTTGLADGDEFRVGDLAVHVHHTPGHTPHHLTFVVRAEGQPPAAFTGGSLLLGSVGRTDLLGDDRTEELTRAQYRSARALADLLPDDAEIHPTHGFGSFCSSGSVEEDSDGTMGREREINLALRTASEDDFVTELLDGLSDYPAYYVHMDPLNRAGGQPVDLSPPAVADADELRRRLHRGEWVVDLRDRQAYASDHLLGTIGIEATDGLATYLGWLIPWGTSVTLLAEDADTVAEVQRQLARIGIDRPAGASTEWDTTDAGPRGSYDVVDFAGLAKACTTADGDGSLPDGGVVLDVRREDEYADAHIAHAHHIPIHELLDRMDELPDVPLWVHCASGFRASICASLLHRAGRDVVLVDDDFASVHDTDLPVTGS